MNIKQEVNLLSDGVEINDCKSLKTYAANTIFQNNDIVKFKKSIQGGNGTFLIDDIELIFENMGIQIVNGGKSNQKADIVLDVTSKGRRYDKEGFGIKSYLGAKPTLLNASGSNTNFIYEVTDFDDVALEQVNKINSRTKTKDRISCITARGSNFKFSRIEAETMNYNLTVLDNNLPKLVSEMLLNFYLNRYNSLSENLTHLHNTKNFKIRGMIDEDGHKIKLKRFLVAVLLGLFSGKKWDGKFSANGTIVVKNDGSQVAFHIIQLSVLEDFLFNEVKFDTPSTTRHRFASVYKERNGKYYFKLNLQLRF